MNNIRGIFRLLYFAFFTLIIVGIILLSALVLGKDIRRSMRIRRRWARHLLFVLGVRINSSGAPPTFPCILMGNHRSYLDPIVVMREVNVYGVSKAEVAEWPLIGFGAKIAGVLFLKRESAESRKHTLLGIAEKLRDGFAVLLFPEGTTHANPTTTAFKPGGFKLAASEGFPIVPVAIDYGSVADYWVGDDTFLPHFLSRFGNRRTYVEVRYGEAIQEEDPQEMLRKAQNWIDGELLGMTKRSQP